jgi:hypothetical protein
MKKVIVLSVNENPIYQFTLPLVVWSWLRIEWVPLIFFVGPRDERRKFVEKTISDFGQMVYGTQIVNCELLKEYRSDTIAQVARLYAANCLGNHKDYVMTGDSDMMALSDYWKFNSKKITVWGHDLTGYQQMPICYIGMTNERWREVMAYSHGLVEPAMKSDLDEMTDARENGNQIERWCTDQRLITKKINDVQFEKEFIHRGVLTNGYPVGRIDRSAWATYHPLPIDCHLPHDIYSNDQSFAKVMRMLYSIFPSDDHKWFVDYTENFKRLI